MYKSEPTAARDFAFPESPMSFSIWRGDMVVPFQRAILFTVIPPAVGTFPAKYRDEPTTARAKTPPVTPTVVLL
jgi:hypothetical protein